MIKYATYKTYKCKKCGNTLHIPHRENLEQEPIEKHASPSDCDHEWEKLDVS